MGQTSDLTSSDIITWRSFPNWIVSGVQGREKWGKHVRIDNC